jgi:hypothetical protein
MEGLALIGYCGIVGLCWRWVERWGRGWGVGAIVDGMEVVDSGHVDVVLFWGFWFGYMMYSAVDNCEGREMRVHLLLF